MPTYNFVCEDCGNVQDGICSINDREEFTVKCEMCGGTCKYTFSPATNIVFKGPGWETKAGRIQSQMKRKNAAAARRQKDNHGKMRLIPNYKGEVVDSWSDVDRLRKEDKKKNG